MNAAMFILALTCGLVIGRLSAPGAPWFRNRSEPLRRRRHVR